MKHLRNRRIDTGARERRILIAAEIARQKLIRSEVLRIFRRRTR